MIFKLKNYLKSDSIQDYGLNVIVRKYLGIPSWLPLAAHMEHGWNMLETPFKSDISLGEAYPIMFVWSKRRLKSYKAANHKFKKVVILGMPFILYKNKKKLSKKLDAKGTVAFPSHDTKLTKSDYDIKKHCSELRELPQEFHPVTICLFYDNMYQKELYESFGFNVVTAGSRHEPVFFKNFYEILSKHKYAVSNNLGSHVFYSVDFEIPFFLLGKEPIINNHSQDPNVPSSFKISDYSPGRDAYNYFNTGPTTCISKEQRRYVEKESGINDAPERITIIIFYWFYFFQWAFNKLFRKIFSLIKKILKVFFIQKNKSLPLTPELVKEAWTAFEQSHYEKFSQSDIINALNDNSVCIDCGANIGNITQLFASKGAVTYTFEPHPICFSELTKKFANNPKIHLINKGVLDKNQTMKLYKFKYHNSDELFFSQGNSIYFSNKGIDIDSYDEIEVIDLTVFIENLNTNIDILKMDIEGAEFCILDKLIDKKLHTKIKHILVETHDNEIPELKEIAQKIRDRIIKENITNIDLTWV